MPDDAQSLSAEIMAAVLAAEDKSTKARREFRRIMGLNRAYRRVFFDDAGNLKPDAREVLEDLIEVSQLGRASRDLELGALSELEGRRKMVLHVFGRFRLPEGRLRELQRTINTAREDEE